jgi:transcriptional regulator with XRE-family HTH domain
MTTRSNLRQLRDVLALTQPQLASLAGCSQHLIHSIETGRARLSAKVANEISRRTGISDAWLTGDLQAPMVALDGKPFTLETFQQRERDYHFSRGPHLQWRKLQFGVGYDILDQMLDAAASEGRVKELAEWFEAVVTKKLEDFPALDDTIRGNHRRARAAAMKTGKAIPLSRFTPFSPQPFKRVKMRMAQAVAAMTASSSRPGEHRNP